MTYVLALAVSLFVAMALIPPLARVAGRLGLVDTPDARKIHAEPVPRIGGLAIIIGVGIAVLLWVPMDPWVIGYLLGAAVIAAFGIWDDRADLDYRLKFLGQFLAAAAVVGIGGIRILHLPLIDGWVLPAAIGMPLTILVLVAVTNAINLTDGLDGLAGGTTLLAITCIALLAHLDNDQHLVVLCLGLVGALFGFLRYNSFPARVFLGDTGSQFLGFSACVLAIVLTQESNTALSPVLPLLLLGLPILDTLVVMTQRIAEGRSPFKPDRSHLHHRLLSVGLDHYEAVLVIYVLQTVLISSAFFLRYEHDALLIGIYLALAAAVVAPLLIMHGRGLKVRARATADHGIARLAKTLGRHSTLRKGPLHYVGIAIPVLLLGSAAAAQRVPPDLGIAALCCLCLLLLTRLKPTLGIGIFDRLIVYTTAAFAVYLLATAAQLPEAMAGTLPAFYALLALAVAVAVRFSDAGVFTISPLDFLVIVLVILLTVAAGLTNIEVVFIKIALQLVIVFYACEMLLVRTAVYWQAVQVCAAIALSAFAARALLA